MHRTAPPSPKILVRTCTTNVQIRYPQSVDDALDPLHTTGASHPVFSLSSFDDTRPQPRLPSKDPHPTNLLFLCRTDHPTDRPTDDDDGQRLHEYEFAKYSADVRVSFIETSSSRCPPPGHNKDHKNLAGQPGGKRKTKHPEKKTCEKRDAFLVIFYLLYYICTLLFQSVPERFAAAAAAPLPINH